MKIKRTIFLSILSLVFNSIALDAQIALGEIDNVYDGGCDGGIEVLAQGLEAPYTIEFEGEGHDYLISPINGSYSFFELCAGDYNIIVTNSYGCVTELGTVTLHECEPLNINTDAILSHPSACGEADGTIRFISPEVSGGTAPYTGIWLDENGNEVPLGIYGWHRVDYLLAGEYTLLLTDANGCEEFFSYTLVGEDEPTVFADINPACQGSTNGFIAVGAVAPGSATILYDFSWSNGISATNTNYSVIENLAAGSYTVTINESSNSECTVVKTYTVPLVPNTALGVETSSGMACPGRGYVAVEVSGGVGPFVYTIDPGYSTSQDETSFTFMNRPAGFYCVTVTDICGNSGESCIEIYTYPEMEISAELTQDALAPGGQGAIDITVTNGTAPYSYLWSNLQFSEDIDGLTSGSYAVTVTDANGCKKIEEFLIVTCGDEINLISYFNIWNLTPCESDGETPGELYVSVLGGQPPYSYEWERWNYSLYPEEPVELLETFDNNSPFLSVVDNGWYNVTVTDYCGTTSVSSQIMRCNCNENTHSISFLADACLPGSIYLWEDNPGGGGSACNNTVHVEWPDGSHSTIVRTGQEGYEVTGADHFDILAAGYHCITVRDACGCEYEPCFYLGEKNNYLRHYTEPINEHLPEVSANFPVYVGCGICKMCGPADIPATEDYCPLPLQEVTEFGYQPDIETAPCAKGQIVTCTGLIEVPLGTQYTEFVDLDNPDPMPSYDENGVFQGCLYDCHCLYPSDAFNPYYFDEPVLIKTQLLVPGDDACDESIPPPPPADDPACPSGIYDYEYLEGCLVETYCYNESLEEWEYIETNMYGDTCYKHNEPDMGCNRILKCNYLGEDYEIVLDYNVPCGTPTCDQAIHGGGNSRVVGRNQESQLPGDVVNKRTSNATQQNHQLLGQLIKVYPNPTSGQLYVERLKKDEPIISLSVIDLLGKEVLAEIYDTVETENLLTVDLAGRLQTGIYYLRVEQMNEQISYYKFVYAP